MFYPAMRSSGFFLCDLNTLGRPNRVPRHTSRGSITAINTWLHTGRPKRALRHTTRGSITAISIWLHTGRPNRAPRHTSRGSMTAINTWLTAGRPKRAPRHTSKGSMTANIGHPHSSNPTAPPSSSSHTHKCAAPPQFRTAPRSARSRCQQLLRR